MIDQRTKSVARAPLLWKTLQRLLGSGFKFPAGTRVIGVQHLMAQAIAMVDALNLLGIQYDNMFLCGKIYSTHPGTVDTLRKRGVHITSNEMYRLNEPFALDLSSDVQTMVENFNSHESASYESPVIVLDDGGLLSTYISHDLLKSKYMGGVEQTSSGLRYPGYSYIDFPIVDIASSAAKRICEPELVVKASLREAETFLDKQRLERVGVLGLGFIGKALAKELIAKGYEVSVYDIRSNAYPNMERQRKRSVGDVFSSASVVFGCCGSDTTLQLDSSVEILDGKQVTLASLSSGDVEFWRLKQRLLKHSELPTEYSVGAIPDVYGADLGGSIILKKNGMPITFNNGDEASPLKDISGTLAALLFGCVQAFFHATMFEGETLLRARRAMLDVDFQFWLIPEWIEVANLSVDRNEHPYTHKTHIEKYSCSRVDVDSSLRLTEDLGF